MKLVLAEKPSVAQSIAKVLGATKREDGYIEGNGYTVDDEHIHYDADHSLMLKPFKPKCCKDCENYQPRWKYRFCFFVRCPYKLKDTTFRRTPLKKEHFPQKEVVRMSDV